MPWQPQPGTRQDLPVAAGRGHTPKVLGVPAGPLDLFDTSLPTQCLMAHSVSAPRLLATLHFEHQSLPVFGARGNRTVQRPNWVLSDRIREDFTS